jgi:hypothetical protein
MKWTLLIAGYSCIFLTACTGAELPVRNGISTRDSSSEGSPKISFGVYDISKSFSVGDLFAPPQPLFQRGIDANVVSTSGTGQLKVENASVRQTEISDTSRKIVKTAEVRLEANEPDKVQQEIASIAESHRGFVVETHQSMSDVTLGVRDSVSIKIRVPADRYDDAMQAIRGSAGRLLVEASKGEDVTEEFIDISARLRAKKALEAQFVEIMKHAETVEDALSVQTQISEVRSEIEKIEGRIRFLEDRSALSTIDVDIQTPAFLAANTAGFVQRLGDSVGRGSEAAFNFTLGLVAFVIGALPFTVFIGLPVFFVGRSIWRRNGRPASITEIANDEIPTT